LNSVPCTCSTTWIMPPCPFLLYVFLKYVLAFWLGWQARATIPSFLLVEMGRGVSWTFYPDWPWTSILLISVSWAARITGMSHGTWPLSFSFWHYWGLTQGLASPLPLGQASSSSFLVFFCCCCSGIKPRVLCLLGKQFIIKLHPQYLRFFNCDVVFCIHAVPTAPQTSDSSVASNRRIIWKACLWHYRVMASVAYRSKPLREKSTGILNQIQIQEILSSVWRGEACDKPCDSTTLLWR
jgi:hypothetical protein